MKKRILSALLAALMCVSFAPLSMAAKKESVVVVDNNIYAAWGGFDTVEDVSRSKNRSSATVELSTTVKASGEGCLKATVSGGFATARIPAPLLTGETYDISFDVRTDSAPGNFYVIFYYDHGGWRENPGGGTSITINDQWKKLSFSWTNDGKNHKGEPSAGSGMFTFRYGNGLTACNYYIDNFSCVPRGNIPDADYSSVNRDGTERLTTEQYVEPEKVVTPIEFADVENHWAKETVNTLATYDYVDGISENIFSPNTNVTRAQFTKMVVDSFNLTLPAYGGGFSDIKGNEWFAPYVTAAEGIGILHPAMTFGGKFQPDKAITREEAASIASLAAAHKDAKKVDGAISFKDESAISDWAKSYVKDAAAYNLIRGYEDGKYLPKNHITRAEAAQILYRIAEIDTVFNIYVDAQNGNDKNIGTAQSPLKTIQAASKMVRQYTDKMTHDIKIRIKGEIFMSEPLELGVEDSGKNGYNIIYTSWGEEKPTLYTGKDFTGFTLHDEEKNIYKVYVGTGITTRQAYFNDKKGVRSMTASGLKDNDIFDYVNGAYPNYYLSDDFWLLDLEHPEDVEMIYDIHWRDLGCYIESVERYTDPESGKEYVKINPVQSAFSGVKGQAIYTEQHNRFPTYFANAYEFLNMEGEWFLDERDGFMYYIPRKGEDMSTMKLTIPTGQNMIKFAGAGMKDPIHNIVFDNIRFAESTWIDPTTNKGHTDNQNYDGTMPGVIEGRYAWYIDFTNNEFTRLGASGLNMYNGVKYCNVTGNEFHDISGHAMIIGDMRTSANPGNAAEYTELCSVTNNYVHDVGTDYKGCAAITVGFARDSVFNHNEIANIPYSGYHISWGWGAYDTSGTYVTGLDVSYNHFEEYLNDLQYDGGAIYSLSAAALPLNRLQHRETGNYMLNIRNLGWPVYPDEGSTSWHIYENVIDNKDVPIIETNFRDLYALDCGSMGWANPHTSNTRFNKFENNYVTHKSMRSAYNAPQNEYGPIHEYPDANWPEEALKIIENAGIEPEYEDNFDFEGAKYFVARQREYVIGKNESLKLDLKVKGRYNTEYSLSDYNLRFDISDPSLLKIDENGVATSTGVGTVWVVAYADVNGYTQRKLLKIYSGDSVEKLSFNVNALNMLQGVESRISVEGESTFGQKVALSGGKITFTSSDESIATVDSNGTVKAIGRGDAVIHVNVVSGDATFEGDIPVTVITYTQPDSLELPFTPASGAFFSKNWKGVVLSANANKVSVTGNPVLYDTIIDNQLIAFDLIINDPSDWPSFTLCGKDRMETYMTDDVYLIGLKEDFIELQRFNKGKRTYIFGDDTSLEPIGGPGIKNPKENPVYTYNGEPISVIIGALQEENGTRVVLTINGVNMFDYLDTDANAPSARGYFGVYTDNKGSFTFMPYTGRTAEGAEKAAK